MGNIYSLPNLLTIFRVMLIPVFVLLFYLPFKSAHLWAAIVFSIASLTDWLDGFLARKLGQLSSFGAFLDPVADKLLVSCCLLLLVGAKNIDYITIPAMIIVGREIVISAMREWMATLGSQVSLAVNMMGKIKTMMQMLALVLLVAFYPSESYWGVLGFILLYVAAILTLWSMMIYVSLSVKALRKV
jgi:CDP-diacylglycerol--glycerol-3-phosphate 3-phosphatidyltransferase